MSEIEELKRDRDAWKHRCLLAEDHLRAAVKAHSWFLYDYDRIRVVFDALAEENLDLKAIINHLGTYQKCEVK